jgi:hypothetical protein
MTKGIPGWGVLSWHSGLMPDGRVNTIIRGMVHGDLHGDTGEDEQLIMTALGHIFERMSGVQVDRWKLGQRLVGQIVLWIDTYWKDPR